MVINICQIEFATPEYDESVRLRYKILREPLGLDFSAEDLAAEYADIHLAAYDAHWILRGGLVLSPKSAETIKMRQVAVDDTIQKNGIGSALVLASEKLAQSLGYKIMELNARDTAIPFYERLNYLKIGDEFVEVNIPHYKMKKEL